MSPLVLEAMCPKSSDDLQLAHPPRGTPPLFSSRFHRTPIHTILDERLDNFESYY